MNASESSSNGSAGSLLKWFVLLGLVVAAVVVVWLVWPEDQPPPDGKPINGEPVADDLAPQQVDRLLELRNLAIGYLENEKRQEADEVLLEIVALLPDDEFGIRNLAINRLLAFQRADGANASPQEQLEQLAHAREAVDAAIGELMAKRPDSAIAHWLRAEVKQKVGELERDFKQQDQRYGEAMQAYALAAAAAPENPAFWYEQHAMGALVSTDDLRAQARAALQKAYDLAPRNLRILSDQLKAQADEQDAAIVDTLTSAKETIAPISRTVQGARYQLDKKIDDAIAAIESAAQASDEEKETPWRTVRATAFLLANILRPAEMTKSDLKRVLPHPLEFALFDYDPAFYEKYGPFEPSAAPAIDVSFRQAKTPGPLSELAGAVDLMLVDFDLDNRLDLLVLRDNELIVLGRAENSEDWTELTRAALPSGARGMIAADLDRDVHASHTGGSATDAAPGASEAAEKTDSPRRPSCHEADVDLIVFGRFGAIVLRNELQPADANQTAEPRRTLTTVEQSEEFQKMTDLAAAVFIDVDHVGDLDLVCSTDNGVRVWSVQGEGMTFEDVGRISVLPPAERRFTSLVVVDWDRDVDLDVLLAGPDGGPAGYLENLRHAQFRWRPFDESFGAAQNAAALTVLEADGRASWDLAAAGEAGVSVVLTATPEPGATSPVKTIEVEGGHPADIIDFDYDNDGVRDLLAWSPGGIQAYRGLLDGQFQQARDLFENPPADVVDLSNGDIDGDGDEDLAVASAGGISLLMNDGGNQNAWLDVRMIGLEDNITGRVNHSGINTLLELKTAARYQAQVVARPTTHFGLGEEDQADILRALMTNGIPQAVIKPQRNTTLCEPQILKGSCPFLYTFHGDRFDFYTDLCWAAPIGLQQAPGVLAPARPWEYLLIEGDRMVPKDGKYELRVTEELWEAAYFDQIELIAVDHPADVEVYSNEKVGPAEIAEFKVHTVRQRRFPVAAVDSQGRDVLANLSNRDGDFLQAFQQQFLQGLVEPHFVELDLGDLHNARKITLFLTGWIYPTDTSLNIGIAQNPSLQPPRPPYVLTPDENGRWRETIPFMGFPGGKTKTIAVDLSGAFVSGDYRLRIAASSQIYWDEIFFTADEQPADVRLQSIQAQAADLHYRGFSALLPRGGRSPHRYDYQQVSTEQAWPPMRGAFTRYGDVRELLTAADDRMVVMAAGDEITLVFDPPPGKTPAGWKRDFLIHNVGWDKDADLNTVYGQDVEPLPFNAMQSYPYADGESYPDTPQTRQYLRTYQTRRQTPRHFWKQIEQFEADD